MMVCHQSGQAGGSVNFRPALTRKHEVQFMSQANSHNTTKLSTLFVDPFVRAAFEAAERNGLAPVCTENLIRVDVVMESPKLAE
jgi:hypothetical protein